MDFRRARPIDWRTLERDGLVNRQMIHGLVNPYMAVTGLDASLAYEAIRPVVRPVVYCDELIVIALLSSTRRIKSNRPPKQGNGA